MTDMDAQKVIEKLIKYMKDSPRTTMEINRVTRYITGIKLDANWQGTNKQFLLNFKEHFRLLDDLVSPSERMSELMRRILLENAIQDVTFLRNISNADEFQKVISQDNHVYFKQYFNLLLVAAQKYDHTRRDGPPKNKRTVYAHDQEVHACDEVVDTREGTLYGGINLPIEELYQGSQKPVQQHCLDVSKEAYTILKARCFEKTDQKKTIGTKPGHGFFRFPRDLWNMISKEFNQQVLE
jgi:hypothetical protein